MKKKEISDQLEHVNLEKTVNLDGRGVPTHLNPFCEGIAKATCLGNALHLIVMDKMISMGLKPNIITERNIKK